VYNRFVTVAAFCRRTDSQIDRSGTSNIDIALCMLAHADAREKISLMRYPRPNIILSRRRLLAHASTQRWYYFMYIFSCSKMPQHDTKLNEK